MPRRCCSKSRRLLNLEKYRVRALRGYLRIARQQKLPDAERLAMCRQALKLADRDEERALVLDALKRCPSAESIELASSLLDDKGVHEHAVETAVFIAEKIKDKDPAAAKAAGEKGAQGRSAGRSTPSVRGRCSQVYIVVLIRPAAVWNSTCSIFPESDLALCPLSKNAPSKPSKKDNVAGVLEPALDAGEGLLRLTPTWVPRSFLHPGKRIKLHPDDWYAYGAHRGGIDERWFSSTTEAANEGRVWHEGLSFCEFEGEEFLLRDAVAEAGAQLIGEAMFKKYNRWPVYSKFFDNMGPIPHHMHQGFEDAKLVGQEGKPESYYFPPQLNNVDNNFAYTFMGLEPGTTKAQVRKCLEDWSKGDNGILDLSRAYRLKRGTGWLIPPGVLHAPGSLCTYEPQWGSDVFGMYPIARRRTRSAVVAAGERHAGREAPGSRLHRRPARLGEERRHALQGAQLPGADRRQGAQRQRLYRSLDRVRHDRRRATVQLEGADARTGRELHAARSGRKRLDHGARARPHRRARYSNAGDDSLRRSAPRTKCSSRTRRRGAGVKIENTGSEPLVGLRYFGPDVHANLPKIGG